MKKIAILLAIVIISGVLPACSNKETSVSFFQYYELNSGEIMIMKYKGTDADVVIPAKIEGKPVTIIDDGAFRNSEIISVTLPTNLKKIKSAAFAGCMNLTTVKFNSDLNIIERDVFSGCSSLCIVEIPKSVKSIGEYAFAKCISLETIKISKDTSVASTAFYGCSGYNLEEY